MTDALTARVAKEWRAERDIEEPMRRNGSRRSSEIHGPVEEFVDAAEERSRPRPPSVELVSADGIEPAPIDRLWNGWLAKGKLQLLAGQPGTGKTTLAIAIAAIITASGIWPDLSRAEAGDVIIWSGEDDPKDTLVPRLIAAGANLKRVHFVKAVSEDGGKRSFDPAKDMAGLAQAIERIGTVKLNWTIPVTKSQAIAGLSSGAHILKADLEAVRGGSAREEEPSATRDPNAPLTADGAARPDRARVRSAFG